MEYRWAILMNEGATAMGSLSVTVWQAVHFFFSASFIADIPWESANAEPIPIENTPTRMADTILDFIANPSLIVLIDSDEMTATGGLGQSYYLTLKIVQAQPLHKLMGL